MFNNKKPLIKVELCDDGTLVLYKKASYDSWETSPLCRINKNEIFFGKGAIRISNVKKLKEGAEENKNSYTIVVKENKKWNENAKKNHPVRWSLRLISRSSEFNYCFGIVNTSSDGELLKSYFSKLGIPINTE